MSMFHGINCAITQEELKKIAQNSHIQRIEQLYSTVMYKVVKAAEDGKYCIAISSDSDGSNIPIFQDLKDLAVTVPVVERLQKVNKLQTNLKRNRFSDHYTLKIDWFGPGPLMV